VVPRGADGRDHGAQPHPHPGARRGAGSIAGIDTSIEGGDNLVALFAQSGWEQLLLALVGWVVIGRYRFLVPAVLLLQLLDWGGRTLVGVLKPMVIESPPPGA
jgi:hypothetical protein